MSTQNAGSPDEDFDLSRKALRPVTPKQASAILGRNIKGIYDAMRRGEIPSIKIGRLRLIPRPAFEKLLREGSEAA